jgi:methionyl-tRNA formyltransferase
MVTFFSLGFKGFFVLSKLEKKYFPLIDRIVIGRDKEVENDYATESKNWCKENNIQFVERLQYNPSLSKSSFLIMIGWKWLIEESFDYEIIVLHDSILPKYRGFNPLVTALIEGDSEIGATAIFGVGEYDTGEIISQKKANISYPCKIHEAIESVSRIYVEIVSELFVKIKRNETLVSNKQPEQNASYSLWRDGEDYRINWDQSSSRILRHIHACGTPYKGAFTEAEGIRYVVLDGKLIDDVEIINRTVGKVIFAKNGNPVIVCKKGLIELTEIINENGKKIVPTKFRLRFT